VSPYSWVYYSDADVLMQRLTEFVHLDPSMAPEGQSSLCAEIASFQGDDLWGRPDQDIVGLVRRDLAKVRLLPEDVPCEADVVRVAHGYPVQIAGYLEIVDSLLGPVRNLSNIVTTGRQGLYKYCNMDECMEMALKVADDIDRGVNRFTYDLRSRWEGAELDRAQPGSTA